MDNKLKMAEMSLSFCIPTYNRCEILHENVLEILKCEDPDIEVVVLDNGSTDNTLSMLQTINDKRLSIYSNGVNKGFLFNILNAVNKGKGKYLIFCTDKDKFLSREIPKFKSVLLSQPDIAAGFCQYYSDSNRDFNRIDRGFPAVREIAYHARHPTGYFFNRSLINHLNITENYFDFEIVDLFPFEFIFGDLCMLGDAIIYYPTIIQTESGVMAAKIKSFGTNGSSKKAFFMPESRLHMAINFCQHINTLSISAKEKSTLQAEVFMRGLIGASLGYKNILNNENLCTHYGMQSRKIGTFEMLKIGFTYSKKFIFKIFFQVKSNSTQNILFINFLFLFISRIIFKKIRNLFR